MPLHTRSSLALVAAALGLALPLSAIAQAVDELTVQAGRLAQRQFDAPASIYSLDGQAVRDAGPQVNLSEALATVPGVVALNRNNYAQDVQISIRGFGARAAFGLRGIRLIADGIPATIPDGQGQASTVALTSVDRIEVLTGPLAQLYGNSAGGVIQTFTREAGPQPEALGQFTMGANGLRRYDAQLSGRSGNVGIVADYSEFSTDGWRAHSAAQRKQFNGVLTTELKPDTRLKLVANVFDMPYAQDPLGLTGTLLAADPRQVVTRALDNNTRKSVRQEQVGAVLEHRFDNTLSMQWRAYTGTRDNLQYQAGTVAGNPSGGSWVGLERRYEGVGGQLQGKGLTLGNGRLDWVAGFELDRSREHRQGGTTTSGEKDLGLTRDEDNSAQNSDAFVQANWHLDPALAPITLSGGLRHSSIQLASQDYYLTDGNGSDKQRYQATNPVLGITWHASDALNVYGNWGRGLETPTLAEVAYKLSVDGRSVNNTFNTALLASRSRHAEVGLKWAPDPATRLQAALFHIGTDNEIITELSSSGKTAYTNASKTSRQGAELSWQNIWGRQWRSVLSASWLQAEYDKEFKGKIAGTPYNVSAGNRLPGIPDKQLFATLQWSQNGFDSNQRLGPAGWSAAAQWMARSSLLASDNDANLSASRVSGYGVLNLKLRHRSDWGRAQLETWLGLDNVTDRRYVGSVIVNQSSAQYFEPGLPRQWMAGVKVVAGF